MTMHLEGPWLSMSGKRRGKVKFRNAEEAKRARELEQSWKDLLKRQGVEAEEKTAGGIIIPDTAQEKPQEGEVVSVGTGTRADDGTVTALDVKAGDKILFGKWSGTEVKLDGEDLLIMKESDILGIIS